MSVGFELSPTFCILNATLMGDSKSVLFMLENLIFKSIFRAGHAVEIRQIEKDSPKTCYVEWKSLSNLRHVNDG